MEVWAFELVSGSVVRSKRCSAYGRLRAPRSPDSKAAPKVRNKRGERLYFEMDGGDWLTSADR